jgi:hypothetical protein
MFTYTIEFLKNGQSKVVTMDADDPKEAILLSTVQYELYDYTPGVIKFNNGGVIEDYKSKILSDSDWDGIKLVKSYIDEGDNEAALLISKGLDLDVRNKIPTSIWLKMGGSLKPNKRFALGGRVSYSEYEYTYFDREKDEDVTVIAQYSVDKYIPATWDQPSEGGYPEIHKFVDPQTKQEVSVPEYAQQEIEDSISDSVEDKEYDRVFAEGGQVGVIKYVKLHLYEPPHHDKVYNVYLKKQQLDYGVLFEFGRRGAHLTEGWKVQAASLDEAMNTFNKLVDQKKKGGYKVIESDLNMGAIPEAERQPKREKEKYNSEEAGSFEAGSFEYILNGDIPFFKNKLSLDSKGLSLHISGTNEYGFPVVVSNKRLSPVDSQDLLLYPIDKSAYSIAEFREMNNLFGEGDIKAVEGETKYYDTYESAQSKTEVALPFYFGLMTTKRIGKLIFESITN